MAYQAIFKRYEMKYLLDGQKKAAVLEAMRRYMALDRYGRSTVRNLYLDTDSYRLIRRSLEKPVYKEKLRIRSYDRAGPEDTVFVELKKKYRGVVYKRRTAMPLTTATAWLEDGGACPQDTQICREIDYFAGFYAPLRARVLLTYDREAYHCADIPDLRITFDENILARTQELSLDSRIYGHALLAPGLTLMEIKSAGAIPLWLSRVLTREQLHKTSFSKYGTAYETTIFSKQEATTHGNF